VSVHWQCFNPRSYPDGRRAQDEDAANDRYSTRLSALRAQVREIRETSQESFRASQSVLQRHVDRRRRDGRRVSAAQQDGTIQRRQSRQGHERCQEGFRQVLEAIVVRSCICATKTVYEKNRAKNIVCRYVNFDRFFGQCE